jgi:hypothetical protein
MAKVKWKTPEPGQVELTPDGGFPFRGPEPSVHTAWSHNLKVGDLIVATADLMPHSYGAPNNRMSPLPFIPGGSFFGPIDVPKGSIGMFLGTMRTNEFARGGSASSTKTLRLERPIVLFGSKKYLVLNFSFFLPVEDK